MTTVGDLKLRILYLLNDTVVTATGQPIGGNSYPAPNLLNSIHASLDAILPWVWKRKIFLLNTPDDASQRVFTLPNDFLQVEAIWESMKEQGEVMIYGKDIPFLYFKGNENQDYTKSQQVWWHLFPQGKITFNQAIKPVQGALIYYAANWAKPIQDSDVLEIPDYAITALTYYAASDILLAKAITSASVRQYNTRVDSGNPEDNPVLQTCKYLQAQFVVACQKLPQIQRGTI